MRVAVVGGGLAGLVAAHHLTVAGAKVTLFEAGSELGGQIRTRRESGFVVEDGAEGFVSADQAVPELCRALGLEDRLVGQLERRSLLLKDGQLVELAPGEAALLLGIQADPDDLGRGVASLKNGMGELIDALGHALRGRATLRIGCAVSSLEPAGAGWRVSGRCGIGVDVDAVVLAAAPREAAAIVEPVVPGAAPMLRDVGLTSNLSVSLAYPRWAVAHPLSASGLVVSPGDLETGGVRACAFSSSKFPNRAPEGWVLLRAFFRPAEGDLSKDDRTWRDRTATGLAPVLGLSDPPAKAWLARWPRAIPLRTPSWWIVCARARPPRGNSWSGNITSR